MPEEPQSTKVLRVRDRYDELKELRGRLENEGITESAAPADVSTRRSLLWSAVLITDYAPGSQFALSIMANLVDPEFSYAACYRTSQDLKMRLATL
jgi:hypothetical protein